MSIVSRNIVMLRKTNNMTQEALAEAMHVSFKTISSWEKGRTHPNIENLKDLAEIFNININDIIYDNKKVKSIDKDIFIQKIIAYEEMFFRISKAILDSDELSCVVIKKTVCEAYQKTNELVDEEDFVVWFIKILINECRKELSKKNLKQTGLKNTNEEKLNFFSLSESLEAKIVAELYYIEKFSVDMIAEITDLAVSDISDKIKVLKGFFD